MNKMIKMALLSFVLCVVVVPATMVAMEETGEFPLITDKNGNFGGSDNNITDGESSSLFAGLLQWFKETPQGSLTRGVSGSFVATGCVAKGMLDLKKTKKVSAFSWLTGGCAASIFAYFGFRDWLKLREAGK